MSKSRRRSIRAVDIHHGETCRSVPSDLQHRATQMRAFERDHVLDGLDDRARDVSRAATFFFGALAVFACDSG